MTGLGLVVFFVFIMFWGLVSFAKFIFSAFSSGPASSPVSETLAALAASAPRGPTGFNKEAVRVRLEDLYLQNKLSKEIFDDLLKLLQITPSIKTTATTVEPVAPVTAPAEKPVSSPVRASAPPAYVSTRVETQPKTSGFFSSENIKTMLVSGCALFVFSAYLFVRSYWENIPSAMKFLALAAMTVGIHVAGRFFLGKSKTPKTAETLLGLSALLIPFNFYAANLLLLNNTFDVYTAWAAGAAAMTIAGFLIAQLVPTFAIGSIMGFGFIGTFIFGGFTIDTTAQMRNLLVSVGAISLLGFTVLFEMKDDLRRALRTIVNLTCGFVIMTLMARGFFLNVAGHIPTMMAVSLLGAVFAIQARMGDTVFAYGAGLSFMGAGAIFLHHLQVPLHQYGLYFIPASILATLRAWSFERAGRKELAAPYFHVGQLAIACSLFAVLPNLNFYLDTGFVTLLAILTIAIAAYALSAVLYKNAIFTYLGGAVVFFFIWVCSGHYRLGFAETVLCMTLSGAAFLLAGLVSGSKREELIGQPFAVLGLGSITVCLALLGGKWGVPFLTKGSMAVGLAAEQLNTAIIVGLLGTAAYSLLAVAKKQAALIFPALATATLTYLFALEKIGVPINLLNTSWVVAVTMLLAYGARLMGWKQSAHSFAVWAEMVFAVIALAALFNRPDTAFFALLVCAASFLPGILQDGPDVASCFLFSIYIGHLVWFLGRWESVWHHGFLYGLQLLIVNCSVVLVRSLITFWRPHFNMVPYRLLAAVFSAISLVVVLGEKASAWQIYLAYGVLALIVSHVHYEGRFKFVGTTLLLASYELLLWARGVDLTEAYSVPLGLYLIAAGFFNRDNKDLRNILYGFGQVALYLPSFREAINETWAWHGVFLGITSLVVMLFGIHQRNRCLTFGSFWVLMINGAVQSRLFLMSVPRWIYLGLGGTTLVALGGLFEFQRETLVRAKKQLTGALEGWD